MVVAGSLERQQAAREAEDVKYTKENGIRTKGKSNALNWSKAVVQILSGDEQAVTNAMKGDSNNLLANAEGMSDVEFTASLLFLIAFSTAGKAGERAGSKRTATKSQVMDAAKRKGTFKSPQKLP